MIILIIKTLLIAYVLSDLFVFIGGLLSNIQIKNKYIKIFNLLFCYILSCSKCNSMWFSLILTGNLFIAAVIALLVGIIKELEYKYKKTEL